MARTRSKLPEGLSQIDYSSAKRIRSAFGSEKEIRAEYSRMRNIITKRVGRLEEAGETKNNFYRIFGRNPLPKTKEVSTSQMMMRMASMARALSGSYSSDLRSIKEERRSAKDKLAKAAKKVGNEKSAKEIKELTDAQYDKLKIIYGILENVLGRSGFYKGQGEDAIYNAFASRTKDESVRSMAARALKSLSGLTPQEKRDALHSIEFRWTTKGKTKVNWKKLRELR